MKSRLSEEEECRRRKEEELKRQLTEQQAAGAARENEIIELYKRLADQNREREREIRELKEKVISLIT